MEVLFFIFSVLLIGVSSIICIRELYLNYFNPIPKLDNKIEKSINKVKFVKFKNLEDVL